MINTPETKTVDKRKKNGYSNKKRLARLNARRNETNARNLAHSKLTVAEKIAKASTRPGESKREVTRLNHILTVNEQSR